MHPAIRSLSLILLTATLAACGGGGDDAVQEAGSRPNSFPGAKNPGDGFSESSTGDSSNANGLAKNEVRITMEVPSLVAPDAPLSRRNLHLVQPDSISVYRTNQTLNKVASVDTEERLDDNGFTVIAFPNGQPIGPDVLIEARYGSITLRAFATDRDRDIKVNPFSEYVVVYGLGGYSAAEFSDVMDCVNSTDSQGLCINKFVWSTLADQVQDFEIDIPDGTSVSGAVALLGARADFARYVNDMKDLAQIAPTSTGVISANSVDMNSVYFGFELGRSSRFSSSPAAQWGVRRAFEERIESNDVSYVYPGLSMTSFEVFGINVTSMASDIPYERSTLARFDNGLYDARGRSFWGINSHATSPSAASIENDDRLLAGQSLYQSITDKNGALTVGWTRNPFYLDAHILLSESDYPSTLIANYFSGGKAIELTGSEDAYKRADELEEHYVSAFDIALAQTDGFSISTLRSDYNIISLSAKLGNDDTIPFEVESMVGTWSGGSDGDYMQTADAQTITRDAGGAAGFGATNHGDTAYLRNRTSELYSQDVDNGRLNLFYDGADSIRNAQGIGASNPDASLLAFNLDNAANGEGILLAMAQGSGGSDEANYRLSGTIAGVGSDTQYLRQINGGRLSITNVGAGEAAISLAGLEVTETISSGAIQRPTALGEGTTNLTYTETDDLLEFTDGGSLLLTGYLSADRKYLILQLRDTSAGNDEFLGLLLGVRES